MSISREEKNGITPELLKEHFKYSDGNLINIKKKQGTRIGKLIGYLEKNGRTRINFMYKKYKAHRLIWVMHYGYIPPNMQIDHIDRDRLNNRIENLRLATHRENSMNRSDNKTGYPGVSFCGFGRWRANIQINKKIIYLGSYKTIEEAVQARREAELKYGLEVREEFHVAI